jgi:hypothetical protein
VQNQYYPFKAILSIYIAMAKKVSTKPTTEREPQPQVVTKTAPVQPEQKKDLKYWLYEFKPQAIIVALLALVVYCNSFMNEFAHDDGIVIVKNEYVLEGFEGIKGILTKDAYDSYYRQLNTTNQLEGGRYRPLSIITFAIEQQFMGPVPAEGIDTVLKKTIAYGVAGPEQQKLVSQMHTRHVFNVLWFMLSVVTLLYFLRYVVFKSNPLMALVATVLFTVHPVHTEVVANVKSRDEIMSLLFMCATFIFAFKYDDNKKDIKMFFAAMVCFFLAFLSKEYAITLVLLIPLAFHIFKGYSIPRSLAAIVPYMLVVTIYLAMRINVLAPPWEDAPDTDATSQFILSSFPKLAAIAAIIALFLYLRPAKKLVSDVKMFTNQVLLFLPYLAIIGIYIMIRKQAIPPVTASAAKEVLNNPYLFAQGHEKLATEIATSLNYLKLLVFPHPLSADYSYATIPYKGFGHPLVWLSIIIHLSLIVLMFAFFPLRSGATESTTRAGNNYVATGKGILCFAIVFYIIHLLLVCNIIFDIGATMGERLIYHSSVGFCIAFAYLLVKGFERIQEPVRLKAIGGVMTIIVLLFSVKTIARNVAWKNDHTLFTTDIKTVPNSVLVNANVAASYITIADLQADSTQRLKYLHDAVDILDHTLTLHRTFVAGYLNRGIAWFKLGNIDKAKQNVDSVRKFYPTYPTLPGMYKLISDYYLRNGWEAYGKVGRYSEAVEEYKKGLSIDSNNMDLWYNMGGALYTNKQFVEAAGSFKKALSLQPNNPQAQQGYAAAMQALNGGAAPPKK